LIGCTASGKGAVGLNIAERIGAEIVCADSMKIYRGMDIGTAKPSPESRIRVRHHVIDVTEPHTEFSVAKYLEMADDAIERISDRGNRILVVGGTALYLKALTEGLFEGPSASPELRTRYRAEASAGSAAVLHARLVQVDPRSADRIHPNDVRRIERALEVYELTGRPISALQSQFGRPRQRYKCRFIGLRRSRAIENRRINARVGRMIDAGLVAEVERLTAKDRPPLSPQARQAVGYREIIDFLNDRTTLEEAIEQIKIHSRRLAKSQRTWFRRFQQVSWFDLSDDESADSAAERILPEIAEGGTGQTEERRGQE
jgi:tRNA dimethylallyltransferase